ncbi:MAG: glycosyltransferase [Bacteroidetes bacterium]|nr:glycosyltransferase [Bacteroidota bacterium]
MKTAKQKILFLTKSEHAYQGAGGRTRIVSEIKVLSGLPLEITIFCLVPLSKFLSPQKLKIAKRKLSKDANTKVIYFPTIPTNWIIFLFKISHIINASIVAIYCGIKRIKIIHAHGVSSGHDASLSKRIVSGIKLITDVHGSLPEEYHHAAKKFDENWKGFLTKIERKTLELSDSIIFVSDSMKEYYQNFYQKEFTNTLTVSCASDTLSKRSFLARTEARNQLSLSDKIVFVYLGSFRKYQMVDETLNLFKEIKAQLSNSFLLILTSHTQQFIEALEKLNIPSDGYKVLSLSKNEVPEYLSAADFGFLIRDQSIVNKVASPTKFAEYLASGVPVILTENVGDYSDFATESHTGFVLKGLTSSEPLINFINTSYQFREENYDNCYSKSMEYLSWQYAGENLKKTYLKYLSK